MMKKYLISLCLVILSFNYLLIAQNASKPSGSGSESDPFKISTLDELFWISEDPNRWSYHYIQISDIDAGPSKQWFHSKDGNYHQGWNPIGNNQNIFTGSFDGNGYIIKDLYINRPESDNIGLFGYIMSPAEIRNIVLENIEISGNRYIGAVIGRARSSPSVSGCSVEGNIKGRSTIGGIIGYATYTHIFDSYNKANITGEYYIGGIAGEILSSSISNSFNSGRIKASGSFAGGITAVSDGSSISNSYNMGRITGNNKKGGLVATAFWSDISNSYWDINTSEVDVSEGGEGRKTDEMTYPYGDNTYEDWDFSMKWASDHENNNHGYPYLLSMPEDSIIFRIKDNKNNMIPNAHIRILNDKEEIIENIYTNDEGIAVVSLYFGDYSYNIKRDCYDSISSGKFNIPDSNEIEYIMESVEQKITIKIDDIDYYPYPDFTIRIFEADNPNMEIASEDTNQEGEAEFYLYCGDYRIIVSDHTNCHYEYTADLIVSGDNVDYNISPEKSSFDLSFKITDENNNPVNGARIAIYDINKSRQPIHVLFSSGGSAKTQVTCGEFTYIITHDNHESLEDTVLIGQFLDDDEDKQLYELNHSMVYVGTYTHDEDDERVRPTRIPEDETEDHHRERDTDYTDPVDIWPETPSYTRPETPNHTRPR